ncbi:MAG: hypothetical protein R3C24_13610 [Cyanobacteriota/Melainabacteria group bacterium]
MQNLGTIPAGIIHIYKWQPNGTISCQYRPLTPYPVYVSSHRQLYSETMVALDKSSSGKFTVSIALPSDPTNPKDVVFEDDWDAYIPRRSSQSRCGQQTGPSPPPLQYGGKRCCRPLGKPAVARPQNRPEPPDCRQRPRKAASLSPETLTTMVTVPVPAKAKAGTKHLWCQGSDTGFPPFVAPRATLPMAWSRHLLWCHHYSGQPMRLYL